MTKRKATLSVAEAAEKFGYTRAWLQKLLIAGTVPAEKTEQGHWRVTLEAMETLAQSRQEREAAQNRRRKRRKRSA